MSGLGRAGYRERIADRELTRALESGGAVVIEGPKACGKTETALHHGRSAVRLDLDATARDAAAIAPELILDGERPRVIDEWQAVPPIWNHVRHAVDQAEKPGQFILTGSASPPDDPIRHTGAGRFSFVRMRTMTLVESGASTGAVSLEGLFDGVSQTATDPGIGLGDLADVITRGGWPAFQERSLAAAADAVVDYVQQMTRVDVRQASGARYLDESKLEAVMRSLARNVATEVANTRLAADGGGPDGPLSTNTVADYLRGLERVFVVEDQPAWGPHLRSKARTRTAPKRHFTDPSIAAALLRASPAKLMKDLNTLGLLFESLVVHDLRVLSQPLRGQVLHYRDSSGIEVDAIVELDDGRWGAIEVKLGAGLVEEGAASLVRFADQIDTNKRGTPAFLAVVSGTGFGYQRPDGVHVVPVGALGP